MTLFTFLVRKHRALKGALRRAGISLKDSCLHLVRKHRAPNGALRRPVRDDKLLIILGRVRKHQAPNGALRRPGEVSVSVTVNLSESTERPVVGGEDTELFVGEASRRGGVRSGGVGMCCEESVSGASEGFGAGRFSQGRGRGRCRHCLSFHSTTLRFLYKCVALWRSDTPTMAPISRTASTPQAFRGDTSSRNEKSGNLASCLLVGGVLFRPLAIRNIVLPGHRGCDTPESQKAPSAKRRIKTSCPEGRGELRLRSESTERQKVH